ncbi:MAG: DUF971 domain-containing protein [Pirellulales bacterium]|nr:DUF971 domain-containing protein [Pirellulales bacterium]
MTAPVPSQLQLVDERTLRIEWSDGLVRDYSIQELRTACPCATCREQRLAPRPPSQLTVLSPVEAQPLRLRGMQPVGNYAYGLDFSDGHTSGIYTIELLRTLGRDVPAG